MWADRYDRALEDVFAVQDEITAAVANAILPAVADAEQRRALRKPPENLSAWEALQRGLWHLSRSNPDDNGQARDLFGIAIKLDATNAAAYSAMALTCLREFTVFAESTPDNGVALAETWARKAVEVDLNDCDAQAVLAFVAHYAGRHEDAWERVKLALAINQNSPMANRVRGAVLLSSGCPSDGRNALLTALRLDPRAQNVRHIMHEVAISYYFEHNYAGAVEAAKRVLTYYPDHHQSHRLLAAALGQLLQKDEAGRALQKCIEISPHNFERYTHNRPHWSRAEDYGHMLGGLRKAGWQG
jgi:adenylate cyclase